MSDISYSLHLSSKSHAITDEKKLRSVSKHNLRKYKSDEYSQDKIEVLIGNKNSIYKDVKDYYDKSFEEDLNEYNAEQRNKGHPERTIDNYLKHVSESKSDVAVEIILQIGDKDFWAEKDDESRKAMSKIYMEQIEELHKICPEYTVVSLVCHWGDEKSPHAHAVGVCRVGGDKRGMKHQSAKTKVFTKQS